LCPVLFRCFNRYLLSESMLVSALEKKPERTISRPSVIKRYVREGSFTLQLLGGGVWFLRLRA
jgi:hypothetical protein